MVCCRRCPTCGALLLLTHLSVRAALPALPISLQALNGRSSSSALIVAWSEKCSRPWPISDASADGWSVTDTTASMRGEWTDGRTGTGLASCRPSERQASKALKDGIQTVLKRTKRPQTAAHFWWAVRPRAGVSLGPMSPWARCLPFALVGGPINGQVCSARVHALNLVVMCLPLLFSDFM